MPEKPASNGGVVICKSFMTEKETTGSETGTSEAEQEEDRSPENSTSEPEEMEYFDSRSAENGTQEVLKTAPLEVPESAPLKSKTKVKNIRKYLLAALFNAPSTMDGYFQAEVNHDMPQYALAR